MSGVLEVAGGDPSDRSGAFGALVDGELDMVHVRGLVDAGAIEALLSSLSGEGAAAYPEAHPFAAVRTFGMMIAPTATHPQGPPLDVYQAACRRFEEAVGGALAPFEEAVLSELSALSGTQATVPDGYGFASVRRMPAGTGSLLHRDNYPDLPAYADLRRWCDLSVQLSWYVQLAMPEEGGALRVYDDETRKGWRDYRPAPGDLLVHPGSVRWHEVLPAKGPVARHTLGGFSAWRADHTGVLSWA